MTTLHLIHPPCETDQSEASRPAEPVWPTTDVSVSVRINATTPVRAEYVTDTVNGAEYLRVTVRTSGGWAELELSLAGQSALANAIESARRAKAGA